MPYIFSRFVSVVSSLKIDASLSPDGLVFTIQPYFGNISIIDNLIIGCTLHIEILITKLLNESVMPKLWTIAKVTSIYKG